MSVFLGQASPALQKRIDTPTFGTLPPVFVRARSRSKRRYGGSDRFSQGCCVRFGPSGSQPRTTWCNVAGCASWGAEASKCARSATSRAKPCNGRAERFCADRWHDGGSEVEQRKSNGLVISTRARSRHLGPAERDRRSFPRSDVRSVNKSESIGLPNRPIAATKRGFRRQIGIDGC